MVTLPAPWLNRPLPLPRARLAPPRALLRQVTAPVPVITTPVPVLPVTSLWFTVRVPVPLDHTPGPPCRALATPLSLTGLETRVTGPVLALVHTTPPP
jgi:hypothetical protein